MDTISILLILMSIAILCVISIIYAMVILNNWLELNDLMNRAFSSEKEADEWFRSPNTHLNGHSPEYYFLTLRINKVKAELQRLINL